MDKIELIKNFVKGATNLKGSNLYTRTNKTLGVNELINYNTVIAVYEYNTKCVYLNNTKYSRTTSKNQNYIRRYSDKIQELSYDELMSYLDTKFDTLQQIEHILRNMLSK